MKMDIEGAELIVLPKLLERSLLCQNKLDKLTIEWHPGTLGQRRRHTVLSETRDAVRQRVMSPEKCGGQPATMVVDFGDESYLNDGMALP